MFPELGPLGGVRLATYHSRYGGVAEKKPRRGPAFPSEVELVPNLQTWEKKPPVSPRRVKKIPEIRQSERYSPPAAHPLSETLRGSGLDYACVTKSLHFSKRER